MSTIASDEAAGQISRAEHAWLGQRYGATPW